MGLATTITSSAPASCSSLMCSAKRSCATASIPSGRRSTGWPSSCTSMHALRATVSGMPISAISFASPSGVLW